ncbi:MAG: hypothetical protein IJ503_03155 [Akkermansia sp.]|nr:hypothetical protein [Akkermansia sp.]
MQQSQPDALLPQVIRLWCDPIPRTGYENMAADELLSRRPEAWLRIYGWAKPAVSFGYFDSTPVAASIFPGEGIEYIRRWTGGGIVDHRKGYTYTVTLPAIEGNIYPPADKLYKWIHGALAVALQASGVECELLIEDAPDGGRACWASPVASDIVDSAGNKLAGAGQRRYRGAVLHQGLIQECEPSDGWPQLLAAALAAQVVEVQGDEPWPGFADEVAELCRTKYCTEAWNDESHGRRKPTVS